MTNERIKRNAGEVISKMAREQREVQQREPEMVRRRANMKTASKAQWHQLGQYSQRVQRELVRLEDMARQALPKKACDSLRRALEHLEKFRCTAEDEMFRRGGPRDTKVFYGSTDVQDDGDSSRASTAPPWSGESNCCRRCSSTLQAGRCPVCVSRAEYDSLLETLRERKRIIQRLGEALGGRSQPAGGCDPGCGR